jgi:hypothetical protein
MIPVLVLAWLLSGGQISRPRATYQTRAKTQHLYAAVPEAERESLRVALDGVIALEKSGKWDEVYEWFDNDRGLTKEQFVQKRRGSKLIDFVTERIYYVPPDSAWVVSGCAVFSPPPPLPGRSSGGVVSNFTARRTGNGWRFGAPPAITIEKDSPGGTRGCASLR